MAREILFKAKRTDNGEWVKGYLVKCRTSEEEGYAIKDTVYHVNDGIINLIPCIVDENTICQYTGLTDKNGNKIWENDIVEHEDLSNGRYVFREQPMKNSLIKWNVKEAKLERSDGISLYKTESTLEVIGNIFDNPELLTE